MKPNPTKFGYFLFSLALSLTAMGQTQSGMTTYSPYTPEQIREFNNQAISPVEGPFGPLNPNAQQQRAAKRQSIDSQYFSQPTGEEEAEALEMESADPYQPITPTISY